MGAVSDAAGRLEEGELGVRAHVSLCDCMCDHACVCQSERMDMCQRREQHHVRVLADDARFRYTNSKSQLSHETISSHDSSTPFLSTRGFSEVAPRGRNNRSHLHVLITDSQLL